MPASHGYYSGNSVPAGHIKPCGQVYGETEPDSHALPPGHD